MSSEVDQDRSQDRSQDSLSEQDEQQTRTTLTVYENTRNDLMKMKYDDNHRSIDEVIQSLLDTKALYDDMLDALSSNQQHNQSQDKEADLLSTIPVPDTGKIVQ